VLPGDPEVAISVQLRRIREAEEAARAVLRLYCDPATPFKSANAEMLEELAQQLSIHSSQLFGLAAQLSQGDTEDETP
jgi:hypothetical protein